MGWSVASMPIQASSDQSLEELGPAPAAAPEPLSLAAAGGLSPQAYLDADQRSGVVTDNGKLSYSIDQAANQLVGNAPGWSGAFYTPFTVTYAYRASPPSAMPDDAAGFQRFSQAQIDQTEMAIRAWEDVANINFVRVGFGDTGEGAYSDNASILLGDYTTGVAGAAAFTYFPGSTDFGSSAGDVWVNASFGYNQYPVMGNYGGEVLVHELGHAIGLQHPSNYDANATTSPTYATDASYYEDDRQYTVMSYFSEHNTGADFGGVYSAAPMLDDIAAAQLEYGPNMSTRTGDTVYGFNSNAGEPWFAAASSTSRLVFAVWDAGGVDTFDFSGFWQDQLIDLRQGFFSNVGGLVGDVAVAKGTVIENAIGGSGSDVIHGNDAGDQLTGGAGDDVITVGAGTNRLFGGDGNDSISGGTGFNVVNGNKGEDTIAGHSLVGDWLSGGQGNDSITSHGDHNILNGNMGADTVIGSGGDEFLRGGQGDDTIVAGSGTEWISGDRGDDTIQGGAGADTFHAFSGEGIDRVLGFDAGKGDHVQVDAGTTYALSQVGGDTLIDMGAGDEMVLVGVQLSSLPQGWIFTL